MIINKFTFFLYSSCQDAIGVCSNPFANVTLTNQRQLLQSNQPYNIILDLELPESEANKQLGMFMVQVNLCIQVKFWISFEISTLVLAYTNRQKWQIYSSIKEKCYASIQVMDSSFSWHCHVFPSYVAWACNGRETNS